MTDQSLSSLLWLRLLESFLILNLSSCIELQLFFQIAITIIFRGKIAIESFNPMIQFSSSVSMGDESQTFHVLVPIFQSLPVRDKRRKNQRGVLKFRNLEAKKD